jgi:hypothetical protein
LGNIGCFTSGFLPCSFLYVTKKPHASWCAGFFLPFSFVWRTTMSEKKPEEPDAWNQLREILKELFKEPKK